MNNNQNILNQLQKNAVKMVFKRKSIADKQFYQNTKNWK